METTNREKGKNRGKSERMKGERERERESVFEREEREAKKRLLVAGFIPMVFKRI